MSKELLGMPDRKRLGRQRGRSEGCLTDLGFVSLVINAERASYAAGRLVKLAERTRVSLLEDIVASYASDLHVSHFIKRGCK